MEAGLNVYGYVNNNPVDFADPFGLYPPNHPYCQNLRRRIASLEAQIAKRQGERHEDKLSLPWRAPGDVQKPSLSRWGHEKIINVLKAKRDELKGLHAAKCNDPEPDSKPTCPVPVAEPNADSKARRLANERAIQRSIDASYAESERLRRNAIVASAIGVFVIAVVVRTGGGAGALLPALAF